MRVVLGCSGRVTWDGEVDWGKVMRRGVVVGSGGVVVSGGFGSDPGVVGFVSSVQVRYVGVGRVGCRPGVGESDVGW